MQEGVNGANQELVIVMMTAVLVIVVIIMVGLLLSAVGTWVDIRAVRMVLQARGPAIRVTDMTHRPSMITFTKLGSGLKVMVQCEQVSYIKEAPAEPKNYLIVGMTDGESFSIKESAESIFGKEKEATDHGTT